MSTKQIPNRQTGSWGPIENPINEKTLELWRKLDSDIHAQPGLNLADMDDCEKERQDDEDGNDAEQKESTDSI